MDAWCTPIIVGEVACRQPFAPVPVDHDAVWEDVLAAERSWVSGTCRRCWMRSMRCRELA